MTICAVNTKLARLRSKERIFFQILACRANKVMKHFDLYCHIVSIMILVP